MECDLPQNPLHRIFQFAIIGAITSEVIGRAADADLTKIKPDR